ncbi:MAG: translation initiation factor IF-2, partial [Archaeoglobi archaeon]|nr:translation initiation factor IF-2 [Candidatus Mnemosynella bozhongmuii]
MSEKKRLRTPIVSVLGHVDHGKTTLLDTIRGTFVAKREAGGITQHIGATEVPLDALKSVCKSPLIEKTKIPGLLFIDTPGHHAFTSLRERGGALADLAILIVDINEGFRPQTVEAVNILRRFRTPFVVAANKIDKIPGWKSEKWRPFTEAFKKQNENAQRLLEERIYRIVESLYSHGFSSERYDRIRDFTRNVCIVPISALTGEGVPDLLLVIMGLAQRFLEDELKLQVDGPAKGTVLEVKEEKGFGTTVDAIIYDGVIRVGDTIVLGGIKEPIVTKVRALLKPRPLKEMRVESRFVNVQEAVAASGVKIVAPDLEGALAGSPLRVASEEEIPKVMEEVKAAVGEVRISTDEEGVIIKADTLGSLEALLGELREKKIPVRKADVGDITKSDVVEAATMENEFYRCVIGFNVRMTQEARETAAQEGVRIFLNNIIYALVDDYIGWVEKLKSESERKKLEIIAKPAKIMILPGFVFRRSNPAIVGIRVLAGNLHNNSE